ncbi:MAG: hypothetical protein ACTS45_00675 [Candidatus Hodgkinia cicadicola]
MLLANLQHLLLPFSTSKHLTQFVNINFRQSLQSSVRKLSTRGGLNFLTKTPPSNLSSGTLSVPRATFAPTEGFEA